MIRQFVVLCQYDDFVNTPMPGLTKFVFVVFAIFVPILLLNMVIAMFVTTYERIISRSEREWKRQVATLSFTSHSVPYITLSPLHHTESFTSHSVPYFALSPSHDTLSITSHLVYNITLSPSHLRIYTHIYYSLIHLTGIYS